MARTPITHKLRIHTIFRLTVLWLVIALLMASCGQTKSKGAYSDGGKRVIKIGYLSITHAAPLYIENEMDRAGFENFELELVRFGSWPDLIDALNTGNIDGASMLVQLAMKAKEQGIDLKTVALGHKDGNVVVGHPDIHSIEDLKGKSFAIPHKFSTHNIMLYQMLKQHGMAYDEVQAVELPPAEMPAALSEGRISGYIVAEPFGAKAVAIDKGKVLFESDDLWHNSICCVLVLRNELVRDHRPAVQEFVNAYVQSGEKAHQRDAHAKQVFTKYMNVEEKVLDLSLQWIQYDDLKMDEQSYEQLRQYMIEMGLSEQPPTFEQFVDNSFIEEVMHQ